MPFFILKLHCLQPIVRSFKYKVHPGYRERLGQSFILNKPQTAMQTTSAVSLETEHDGSFHGFQGFMKRSTATAYLSPKRIYPRTFPEFNFFVIIIRTDCLLYGNTGKKLFEKHKRSDVFSFFLGPYPSLVALVNLLISRHNRRFLQHQSVDDGADLLG